MEAELKKTTKLRDNSPPLEENWRGTSGGFASGDISSFTNSSTTLSTMRED
jgi:hypothetical protein